MKNIIRITKSAKEKLNHIAKEHNAGSLLFYIKGGGCNGFNYKLEPFYGEPHKLDEIVKCDKIDIVVCNKSLMHLFGTTIDWKTDIMGDTFNFENPNASSQCGCGTSFSI
jgi:iron-sulfur cluster assembly accessory protein